jgi:hypothetical protein
MRSVEQFVIMPVMLILPEILDKSAQLSPFGLPENEARSDVVLDCEKFELFAEFPMIPLFCLFQGIKMLV